jgi:hypothetical protein
MRRDNRRPGARGGGAPDTASAGRWGEKPWHASGARAAIGSRRHRQHRALQQAPLRDARRRPFGHHRGACTTISRRPARTTLTGRRPGRSPAAGASRLIFISAVSTSSGCVHQRSAPRSPQHYLPARNSGPAWPKPCCCSAPTPGSAQRSRHAAGRDLLTSSAPKVRHQGLPGETRPHLRRVAVGNRDLEVAWHRSRAAVPRPGNPAAISRPPAASDDRQRDLSRSAPPVPRAASAPRNSGAVRAQTRRCRCRRPAE